MDFRFIAVLMIIMAILDLLGRTARKRAAAASGEEGDSLEGVDEFKDYETRPAILQQKALTAEEPKPPGLTARSGQPEYGAGRRPDEVRPREAARARIPPAGGGRGREIPAVPRRAEPTASPGMLPAAAPPAPAREAPVPELRDRAPREIEVRSRDPRPVRRQPVAPVAGTSAAAPADLPAPAEPVVRASSRRLVTQPPPVPGHRPRSVDIGSRLGLGSNTDLRRVVLAREVLGPPLAMRDR